MRHTVLAAAAVLGYGTVVHVVQLIVGPVPFVPGWRAVDSAWSAR